MWQDHRTYGIYGARVTSTGTVLDNSGILISPSTSSGQYSPAVAHDGTNFLVVWYVYQPPSISDISGSRVSGTGTVLDTNGTLISTSANGQYSPAVAHDGTNFLVVWQDYRSGYSTIYGVRVSEAGEVLDPSGIAISTATLPGSPAVAYGGTNFLVVWVDHRNVYADIYGALVNSDGTVLNTEGIPISKALHHQYAPAVTHDGANFLVVWEDGRNDGGTYSDIYGARVNSDGTVLDTDGIPISKALHHQYSPAVAHFGENFLVVWTDSRNGSGGYDNPDIYSARVSTVGTVLDPNGIPISQGPSYQDSPAIAHNGMYFFVVWQDNRSNYSDIYGARVNSEGTVIETGGISISAATNYQYAPSVTYDQTNFLVVWQDTRSGTGFSDIYGARVSDSGSVLETSGFAISAEPVSETEPVLTAMGERSLVVYRSSHVSASTNSERVLARIVEPSVSAGKSP